MKELSPATQEYIEEHRNDDVRRLALNPGAAEGVDMAEALTQIEGWQMLSLKVPLIASTQGFRYPRHLPLEQCSCQETARYKQKLVAERVERRDLMVDLTGGLGVDFCFIAPLFTQKVYVERQEELCHLATHNFPLLGLGDARVVQGDGIGELRKMGKADFLFLDPARRGGDGRKVVLIEDCEPDVALLSEELLERSPRVLIKLSPMLDLQRALRQLPSVQSLHVVAVRGEVKEVLVVMERDWRDEAHIVCADIQGDGERIFSFLLSDEASAVCPYASGVKKFLYEPSASLLKAGAFRLSAVRYGLSKLAPNSHLYTSDELVEQFPGRAFEVENCCGFGKKELRSLASRHAAGANLTVRNFPSTVAELRRRLRLKEGGDAYLFVTTLNDGSRVVVECRKRVKAPLR